MIDNKLTALHQWIVDETEKKPMWLARQVIMPAIAIDLAVRAMLWENNWTHGMLLIGLLLFGAILVYASHSEVLFKKIGESPVMRLILLALTAFYAGTIMVKPNGIGFLYLISTALTASYYYFAICEAPRPKKRQQLVLQKA